MATNEAESGFDIKRLKFYREKAGLSQTQLGKKSGVHPIQICHYETGRHKPHARQIAKLEAALSACFREGLPPAKPTDGRPPDSHRIVCPHCGASSFTFSENSAIEYKCISCCRIFRPDGKVTERPTVPKTHDAWHRNGKRSKAKP